MKSSNAQLPLSKEYRQKQQIKLKIISALRRAWQQLIESFVGSNELRIWQTYDCFGNNWWHAYDPVTGRYTSVDSEAEMRVWIEHRVFQETATLDKPARH